MSPKQSNSRPVKVLVTVPEMVGKQKYFELIKAVSPRVEIAYRACEDYEQNRVALREHPGTEVYLVHRTPKILENAESLRWLMIHHAGIEADVASQAFDAERGIVITNSAGAHAVPIAEYVITVMVMLLRGFMRLVHDKETRTSNREHSPARELSGLTVGIIGYGHIGREVARMAMAHRMRVIAMKNNPLQRADDSYHWAGVGDPEGKIPEKFFGPTQLMEMLPECDFVIDCLPHTPRTDKLFSMPQFKAMKRSAYFINVGRGGTMSIPELSQALKEGLIAGAGLDDFMARNHNLPIDSPIWDAPNTFISPHISGTRKSAHYLDRTIELFCENLRRYLDGQPLYNVVTREKGY